MPHLLVVFFVFGFVSAGFCEDINCENVTLSDSVYVSPDTIDVCDEKYDRKKQYIYHAETRHLVLAEESEVPVEWDTRKKLHKVTSGKWTCQYTGRPFTDPKDLQIDHLVPLKEVHYSGGFLWSPQKREEYANDMTDPNTLIAVHGRANMSKGERDPARWMPEKNKCQYLSQWQSV